MSKNKVAQAAALALTAAASSQAPASQLDDGGTAIVGQLPAASAELKAKAEALQKAVEHAKIDGMKTAEVEINGMAGVSDTWRKMVMAAVQAMPDRMTDWLDGYYQKYADLKRSDAKVRKAETKAVIDGALKDFAAMQAAKSRPEMIALGRKLRGSGQNSGGSSANKAVSAKKAQTLIAEAHKGVSGDMKGAVHLMEKITANIVTLPDHEKAYLRQIQNMARALELSTKEPGYIKAAQNIRSITEAWLTGTSDEPAAEAAQQEQQQNNAPAIKAA